MTLVSIVMGTVANSGGAVASSRAVTGSTTVSQGANVISQPQAGNFTTITTENRAAFALTSAGNAYCGVRYGNNIKRTPVVWNYANMLKNLHLYMRYCKGA